MVIKKGSREFSSRSSERSFVFASLAKCINEKKAPSGCSRKLLSWTFPAAIISRASLNSASLPTGNAAVVLPKKEEFTNKNIRTPPVLSYSIAVQNTENPTESSPKDEENHSLQIQNKSSTSRCTIQADLRKCFHISPSKGNNRHHRPWRGIVQRRNASLVGSASKRLARRVDAFQKQCVRKMEKTLNHIGFMGSTNSNHNTHNNQKTRLDRILHSLQQPRFQRGQFVLVCNIPSAMVTRCSDFCPTTSPTTPSSLSLNTTRNLVNRHGYPRGGGGTSLEERQGPYLYVLAEIQQVHCGDGLGCVPQYTIFRADTGEESWMEEVFMEPILSEQGRLAALKAARRQQQDPKDEATLPPNKDTGTSVEEVGRAAKGQMASTMDEIIVKCKIE